LIPFVMDLNILSSSSDGAGGIYGAEMKEATQITVCLGYSN
jgi:hypothetical protein